MRRYFFRPEDFFRQRSNPQDMFMKMLSFVPFATLQCEVCCEKYKIKEMTIFGDCGHRYCRSCLNQHVKDTINSFKIIKCLNEDCTQSLDFNSPHIRSLDLPVQQKYYKIRVFLNLSKNQQIKICPTQDCDGFLKMSDHQLQCPICYVFFCRQCMLPRHRGSCDHNGAFYLAEKFLFKRCSRCMMMLEKNQGCEHMTCLCGHQFCYVCGAQWVGGHNCRQINNAPVLNQVPVIPPASAAELVPYYAPPPRQQVTLPKQNIILQLATCLLYWGAIILVHFITLQFIYSIVMYLVVLFFSIKQGILEMIKNETCLKICLLNIFLILYYAIKRMWDIMSELSVSDNSRCIFPISSIWKSYLNGCLRS